MENKRYLKIFNTEEEYNAEKNKGSESIIGTPHIVLIEGTEGIENYNKIVFSNAPKQLSKGYFNIEALSNITIKFSQPQDNFQYYIEGEDESWKKFYVSNSSPIQVKEGYKIYFKINDPDIHLNDSIGIGTFIVEGGDFNVAGNNKFSAFIRVLQLLNKFENAQVFCFKSCC